MSTAVEQARRVWTESDLQALPDDGYVHELVNGELVMSPKNNYQQGDICSQLLIALGTHAKAHKLGAVLGFKHWILDAQPQLPCTRCLFRFEGSPQRIQAFVEAIFPRRTGPCRGNSRAVQHALGDHREVGGFFRQWDAIGMDHPSGRAVR